MKSNEALHKGNLVAEVLSGSWRTTNIPALRMTEAELDALGTSPSAEVLHQAYRLQSLQSEIHEQKIEKVFRLFHLAGVDAVLAKGWATAGLYSERTLRPYGDIDVCVRPEHFKIAIDVLNDPEASDCWVDLHQHFYEIEDRTVDQLFTRSRALALGKEQVSILGPEDQLALSCIHLLKHGAWRPLWLCDIGVAIESLPAAFDWDICLGSSSTRANWIICAIGLAKRLLRVDTAGL